MAEQKTSNSGFVRRMNGSVRFYLALLGAGLPLLCWWATWVTMSCSAHNYGRTSGMQFTSTMAREMELDIRKAITALPAQEWRRRADKIEAMAEEAVRHATQIEQDVTSRMVDKQDLSLIIDAISTRSQASPVPANDDLLSVSMFIEIQDALGTKNPEVNWLDVSEVRVIQQHNPPHLMRSP